MISSVKAKKGKATTVGALRREVAERLAKAGIGSAALEANISASTQRFIPRGLCHKSIPLGTAPAFLSAAET